MIGYVLAAVVGVVIGIVCEYTITKHRTTDGVLNLYFENGTGKPSMYLSFNKNPEELKDVAMFMVRRIKNSQ